MSIIDIVSFVKDIATLFALVIGGFVAVAWFLQLAPLLELRILPSWCGDQRQFLMLRLEVENKSRIRVEKRQILLQLLEYEIREGSPLALSDWVPFDERAIIPTEQPLAWRDPVEVFPTCRTIDPGELMAAERLYYFPRDTVIHIGFQVKAKLGYLGRIAARRVRSSHQQWTTTCIVVR